MTKLAMAWFWSLAADLGAKLAPALTVLAYYQVFGSVVGAEVVVKYSYVISAWVLIDLGLGLFGAREVARHPEKREKMCLEITIARLFLLFPVGSVLVVSLWFGPGVTVIETFLFLFFLLGKTLSLDWSLRGEERFRELSEVNQIALVAQILSLTFILFAGEAGKPFLWLPFAVWGGTSAVMTWKKSGLVPRKLIKVRIAYAILHIRYSHQLTMINGVSVLTQQLPLIFLSQVAPVATYAGFALLHRLILSSTLVFSSLVEAAFPRMVREMRIDAAGAYMSMLRLVLLIAATAFVFALVGIVLTGHPYIATTFLPNVTLELVLIMAAYLVLRSVRIAPTRLLIAADLQRPALVVTLSVAIISVVSLFTFASLGLLNQLIATWMFLLAEVGTLAMILFQSWRLIGRNR